MSLSTYPASEAEYDMRAEAQPVPKKLTYDEYTLKLKARIEEIATECWAMNPKGDYSLEEAFIQEADALAPLGIEIIQSEFLLATSNKVKKLNKLMRERLKVYAQPIAEAELEGWK